MDKQNTNKKIAAALIKGGPLRPQIEGLIAFQDTPKGTKVCVEVRGLPPFQREPGQAPVGPHGFHIHEFGNNDAGDPENPFQAAGGHWNPDDQPHGNHAGDFPVLFSYEGNAGMCFYTDRFVVEDIIDKSVVIHESPDDHQTQPTGNSGRRLACGVIGYMQLSELEIPDLSRPIRE